MIVHPQVLALAQQCLDWLMRFRPFEAWFEGAEPDERATQGWSRDDGSIALQPLIGGIAGLAVRPVLSSRDRAVLGQLSDWCARQQRWITQVRSSPRVFAQTVLQACVYLEEADDGLSAHTVDRILRDLYAAASFDPASEREHLSHSAELRHLLKTNRLASFSAALDNRQPCSARPANREHAAEAASLVSLETAERALLAAAREYESSVRQELPSALDARWCATSVEAIVEDLVSCFGSAVSTMEFTAPVIRRSGSAAARLGPHAFFRPGSGGGELFCGPLVLAPADSPDPSETLARVLAIAHETVPGHSFHHCAADPALRPVAPVLKDRLGAEGWAVWAEGLLPALHPGLTATSLWFRIKRLLPFSIARVKRDDGPEAAQRLLDDVFAAAPSLAGAGPASHQLRTVNRAYAEGYLETVAAIGAEPGAGHDWQQAAAPYLAAAAMRPHRAALFATAVVRGEGNDHD